MSSATLCNKCVFCGHFGVAGIVLPAAVPSLERCWARQGGLGMFSPRCAACPKMIKDAKAQNNAKQLFRWRRWWTAEWFHPEDFSLMTYVSPVFSLLSCLIMFYIALRLPSPGPLSAAAAAQQLERVQHPANSMRIANPITSITQYNMI